MEAGKEGFAYERHLLDDTAGPGRGTSPVIPCLRRSLARTRSTKPPDRPPPGAGHRVRPGRRLGQCVNRRRQRGKVRPGVLSPDSPGRPGWACPDLTTLLELRGLLAVISAERPAHAVQPDPVAGASSPRCELQPPALSAAVRRTANRIRPVPAIWRIPGPPEGRIQCDHLVANDFEALDAKIRRTAASTPPCRAWKRWPLRRRRNERQVSQPARRHP